MQYLINLADQGIVHDVPDLRDRVQQLLNLIPSGKSLSSLPLFTVSGYYTLVNETNNGLQVNNQFSSNINLFFYQILFLFIWFVFPRALWLRLTGCWLGWEPLISCGGILLQYLPYIFCLCSFFFFQTPKQQEISRMFVELVPKTSQRPHLRHQMPCFSFPLPLKFFITQR